jgi:hypothetical protein
MKISIAASILILAAGAVIGWHERQQLAALRTTQEHLAAKATKLGVSSDPAQATKRERPTRAPIAKLSLTEVLEIAKEIQRLNTPDGLNHQAIGALNQAIGDLNWRILDSLTAWDVTELKALLAEIRTNPDLNQQTRSMLVSSCTTVLAYDHSQAALGMFTSSPELFTEGKQMGLVCTALACWAKHDLTAAIEWLKKNPLPFSDYAESGIISAVAEQDPQHAFRLIGQMGLKDKSQAAWQIVNSAKTFDQKSATLAALREYLPSIQTGDLLDEYGKSYLRLLAADMHREGIEDITGWIFQSKLTPQELDPFLDGLAKATHSDETGRWIEWMRQSLSTEQADRRIENLIHQWATRDYQAAAQWATSQPEGKDRAQVLETIHAYWPKHDPLGKEAFAQQHGIR